jgi:hypothetical protein
LYAFGTWEEHILKVSENMMLKKLFGPRRGEVTEGRINFNEE